MTIAPVFQRRGFAREALAAAIDCLFHRFQKHRIVASVDPRNAASIGLIRSVGMRQEALFLQSVPYEGGWTDDAVFAILATEWRRQRPPAGRP